MKLNVTLRLEGYDRLAVVVGRSFRNANQIEISAKAIRLMIRAPVT